MDENQADIHQLKIENQTYQRRIAELENDLSRILKEKSLSSQDITEILSYSRSMYELEKQITQVQSESFELRAILAAHSGENTTIDASFDSVLSMGNNQYLVDLSKKYAEMQTEISSTKLENAQLKRSISEKEAENAQLTIEIHMLKKQITDSTGEESINRNANYTIQKLQRQIDQLNSELSKYRKSSSNQKQKEIEQHEEELERAQKKIRILTKKNEKSDEKIASYVKELEKFKEENKALHEENKRNTTLLQSIENQSDDDDTQKRALMITQTNRLKGEIKELKALCTSIQDQNTSMRQEISHLRSKSTELSKSLQKEKMKNASPSKTFRQISNMKYEINHLKNMTALSQRDMIFIEKHIKHHVMNMILKFDFFFSNINGQIDRLGFQCEKFRTGWNQMKLRQVRRNQFFDIQMNTRSQFIDRLKREKRLINEYSHDYAKAHSYPIKKVPHPGMLIGSPTILNDFLDQVDCVEVDKKPRKLYSSLY